MTSNIATATANYTSLESMSLYSALPQNLRNFAYYVAAEDDGRCPHTLDTPTQISVASCIAQYPEAVETLMAGAATRNSLWYSYVGYSFSDLATDLPTVTSLYSDWLGQPAVQGIVTSIPLGDTTTLKPTVTQASQTSPSPEQDQKGSNQFDRLSVVEKVFTIIGVVVAVIVPFIIFFLTRRYLNRKNKKRDEIETDKSENAGNHDRNAVSEQVDSDTSKEEALQAPAPTKKKWSIQSPITWKE